MIFATRAGMIALQIAAKSGERYSYHKGCDIVVLAELAEIDRKQDELTERVDEDRAKDNNARLRLKRKRIRGVRVPD